MTMAFQPLPQGAVIVDFTIEGDYKPTASTHHRLRPGGGQVDDGKSAMS